MNHSFRPLPLLLLCAATLFSAGCKSVPGYPKPGPEVPRPEAVLDFPTLYQQNCSGCHGTDGHSGAALPMNNAAYLAVAGPDNLRNVIADGVKGSLMPPFAHSAGGMLTDQQIDALVHGMLTEWGRPAEFAHVSLPPYAATAPGNPANGQKVFAAACASCHGDDGTGVKPMPSGKPADENATTGSIVDQSYLALVSDQGIRSFVLAGHAQQHIPDWRGYLTGPGAHALTPQEISDVVAWLTAHRSTAAMPAAQDPHAPDSAPQALAPPAKETP